MDNFWFCVTWIGEIVDQLVAVLQGGCGLGCSKVNYRCWVENNRSTFPRVVLVGGLIVIVDDPWVSTDLPYLCVTFTYKPKPQPPELPPGFDISLGLLIRTA